MTSFLSVATRIAANNANRWKHGAILVKSGRVLATAPNVYKNSPELFHRLYPHDLVEQKQKIREHCSEHAEARVVRMAGDNARGAVIYVSRVNAHGDEMMSRPCNQCYATMSAAGVKSVVYTEGKKNTVSNGNNTGNYSHIMAA